MATAAEKLQAIRSELAARYLERDAVIEGLLAALLAREHVLLLGPVGTAKSMLAADACARVDGAVFFNALLTKFSTPEELFGPVSLKGLEQDEYRRVTAGKLPTAHIAFLDEVFKSSSAILNALLSVMNERIFHNGAQVERVPLVTLVGASNELPDEGELMALYDRFLLRFVVDYLQEDFRFLKMLTLDALTSEAAPRATTLTRAELESLQAEARAVVIDDRLLGDLVELRRRLGQKGIVASDRRYRQSLALMRGYALLRGRTHVTDADLAELRHVLWGDPNERDEVRSTLEELLHGHQDDARALLVQAQEVRAYALRDWPDGEMAMRASIEAHTKLKSLLNAVEALLQRVAGRGRGTEQVEEVVEAIRDIQRDILTHSLHA